MSPPSHRALIDRLAATLPTLGGLRLAGPELRPAAVAVLLVERDGQTWVPMIEPRRPTPGRSPCPAAAPIPTTST